MIRVGLPRRASAGGRREHRQRQDLQLRLRGAYGPDWWEVAPAVVVAAGSLAVPLSALLWLWSYVGWWAAVLAFGGFAYGAWVVGRRLRALRARAGRRRERFALAEVDAADDRGYRHIVGRLLQRDGWHKVRGIRVNDSGAVHLVGEWPGGEQRLGVAFERARPGISEDPCGVAALRPVVAPDDGPRRQRPAPLLLVVVSSGSFSRQRVVWAARSGVHLVDRPMLARWAAGEDLAVLLDLASGRLPRGDGARE
ncbi:hypothetical protein AN218_08135 [Streptomyces nanshensis]|uniref:Restriction endonuclease type IV Mrr domain-containing protein n=1 Tax=Streptomyces nanshensis TaxID=518642 RepID=A0A1E7L8E0_9ACTN|nr:hypothetical protein AN218_08135 [Streptomyces nanshensis]